MRRSLTIRSRASQRKLKNGVIRWLKLEEETAVLLAFQKRIEDCDQADHLQEGKWECHHLCEFVISPQTGMRRGEQYGLTWAEVNFKRQQIHVKELKNRTERYIPILPCVVQSFRTLKIMELQRKDRRKGEPNQSPEDSCFALADPKSGLLF